MDIIGLSQHWHACWWAPITGLIQYRPALWPSVQQSICVKGPKYVWPLGNTTVHREIMSGRDAHLPANDQCFVFSDGYPGFPYKALTLTGEGGSFVDFYMRSTTDLQDLAVSLWVFPIGEPEGTIVNYLCETGNVIKIAVLEGLLFVSFWDEYGVSVGATAVPELLVADTWNHLVVSRQYHSGRIQVGCSHTLRIR
ncbi:hypothetical protein ElyMa_005096000 [Elysia marginata]|uniref:Laminin G domain-containing protein n=1 Tax=Elysia marginata TaxID=1093978 RepID=A0AAV4JGN8_9GAST|nr:hypothetical protein ElyMa_005096000 [Elysia marginata]